MVTLVTLVRKMKITMSLSLFRAVGHEAVPQSEPAGGKQ